MITQVSIILERVALNYGEDRMIMYYDLRCFNVFIGVNMLKYVA